MIRYRIKTIAEFEKYYRDRGETFVGLDEVMGWCIDASDCGNWFGIEITKTDYERIINSRNGWDSGILSYNLESYDKFEEASRIGAGEGNDYDSEWTISDYMVIAERYGEIKSHKDVKVGDVIIYRKQGRIVEKIYKENKGAELEFTIKSGKGYVKYKNAKIVGTKILNKVK